MARLSVRLCELTRNERALLFLRAQAAGGCCLEDAAWGRGAGRHRSPM